MKYQNIKNLAFILVLLIPITTTAQTDEWYLRTEDKAASLYICEVGKGEPVVVIHGGPGADHRYMLDVGNRLEKEFRFVFYDQRGSSFSPARKDLISIDKHLEDLETIRKALGVEKINLMSHSAGTQVAMNYLKKYPNNVKNLILLGATDPKNGDPKMFSAEHLKLFEQGAKERELFRDRPEVQAVIIKAGLDKSNLTPKQEFDLRHIKMAAANVYHVERWKQVKFFLVHSDAANATQSSINFVYDWSDILAKHPYPVTVINGEYDYVVGPKGSPIWKSVIAESAPNVKLILIENAGHASWVDAPVIFKNEVRKALTAKNLRNKN